MSINPPCRQLACRLIDDVVQAEAEQGDRCTRKHGKYTRAQRPYAVRVALPEKNAEETHARAPMRCAQSLAGFYTSQRFSSVACVHLK
jgi:hypothetical protein